MDEQAYLDREAGLERGLSKAQIIMIGLGGAIGTGLFMGSGIAIGYAGPGVLISYLIAALVAVIMVFSLSEMAVVHPTAGSFGTYAEIYLGPMMGFIVRYTYWIQQVLLIGSEAVAVGIYMGAFYLGATSGPVLGALVLHILADVTRNLFGQLPGINMVIYGVVLVLIVMFLPRGIAGIGQSVVAVWKRSGGRHGE